MKYFTSLAAIAVLAACTTPTPNDFAGAGDGGFRDSQIAQAERESALTGKPVEVQPLNAAVRPVPVDASPANPSPVGVVGITPVPERPTDGVVSAGASISDEQNFDAVADRETIESDAARLANNRQQYTVIQPTDLPTRQGQRPNIVEYALQTNNPVGVQLYSRRSLFSTENKTIRNCASYASSDMAQQDFLARGGPTRDRLALDPDGDGFACKWDPRPFRLVRQGG